MDANKTIIMWSSADYSKVNNQHKQTGKKVDMEGKIKSKRLQNENSFLMQIYVQ